MTIGRRFTVDPNDASRLASLNELRRRHDLSPRRTDIHLQLPGCIGGE
jgi:hypothetical protein